MWCYYNQADEVELFVNGKLCAMSESRPTGTNSVVLKMKAATASVTTRSHATLRETVFVVITDYRVSCEKVMK